MKKLTIAILMALSFTAYAETDYEVEASAIPSVTPEVIISTEKKFNFPAYINQRQAEILTLAQQIAEKDGQKEPKLLQGLLMQESSAGANPHYLKSPDGNHGVAQIRVTAARHVLRDFPELTDEFHINPKDERSLIRKLVHDDAFNISVASKYLLILQKAGYSTMKHLALAYNQGAGGAKRFNPDTFPYVRGVIKHIKSLTQ